MCIYIYILFVCVCIYIYIQRERERHICVCIMRDERACNILRWLLQRWNKKENESLQILRPASPTLKYNRKARCCKICCLSQATASGAHRGQWRCGRQFEPAANHRAEGSAAPSGPRPGRRAGTSGSPSLSGLVLKGLRATKTQATPQKIWLKGSNYERRWLKRRPYSGYFAKHR